MPALTGVFAEALKGGVSNLSFGDLSGQLGEPGAEACGQVVGGTPQCSHAGMTTASSSPCTVTHGRVCIYSGCAPALNCVSCACRTLPRPRTANAAEIPAAGRTMYRFKFQIPSYYTLLVRSLSVLEVGAAPQPRPGGPKRSRPRMQHGAGDCL